MTIRELDRGSFEATVSRPGIVLVDCWAAWCGPCKLFAPVFERAAAKHEDHLFAKLDTETNQDLVATLGIEQIPTLLLYRDGVLLVRRPGSISEAGLSDIVRQAEALDMDQVRADLEAEESRLNSDTEAMRRRS